MDAGCGWNCCRRISEARAQHCARMHELPLQTANSNLSHFAHAHALGMTSSLLPPYVVLQTGSGSLHTIKASTATIPAVAHVAPINVPSLVIRIVVWQAMPGLHSWQPGVHGNGHVV